MSQEELPRRVLVALSFTDDPLDENFGLVPMDKNLITQALWYAQQVGGSLTFLHALEEDDISLPGQSESMHQLLRRVISPLMEEVAARAKHMGVEASYIIRGGDAWNTLLEEVKENDHQLVMTGPRRRDQPFFDHLMHGSTTRRLSRHCPVPVWITRPNNRVEIKRVLVPVDFSKISQAQVEAARQLKSLSGAELILVHFLRYPGEFAASRSPDPEASLRAYRAEVQQKAEARARALLGDDYDDWTVVLSSGELLTVIDDAITSHDVDLVVMGSSARKGLAGLVVGNTAEKVISTVPAPVWVLKHDG
jgi:nucleotide-binding universal stress UspA family protein